MTAMAAQDRDMADSLFVTVTKLSSRLVMRAMINWMSAATQCNSARRLQPESKIDPQTIWPARQPGQNDRISRAQTTRKCTDEKEDRKIRGRNMTDRGTDAF